MIAPMLLLAALALLFLAGCGLFRLLAGDAARETPCAERFGLWWLLGCGFISLATFGVGFAVSGWPLIAILSVSCVALFVVGCRRSVRSVGSSQRVSASDWVLRAILLAQFGFLIWWAPQVLLGWDALVLWEAKARMAFSFGGALPVSYFGAPGADWAHVYYPLSLPYTESWLYSWLGRADQSWIWVIGVLTYGSVILILIGAAQRLGAPRIGAWIAGGSFFFVPYCFTGLWNALSGYADLPLGVIYLAAISRLPAVMKSVRFDGNARLLSVLAALAIWMKQEGLLLWMILIGLPVCRWLILKQWKSAVVLLLPGLVIGGGFKAFLKLAGATESVFYHSPTLENLIQYSDRLVPVLQGIGNELLNFEHWSLLWIGALVALAVLAGTSRSRGIGLLLACGLLAPLFVYIWPFVLSRYVPISMHMEQALPRLIFQLAPTAMLVIAVALPRGQRNEVHVVSGGD